MRLLPEVVLLQGNERPPVLVAEDKNIHDSWSALYNDLRSVGRVEDIWKAGGVCCPWCTFCGVSGAVELIWNVLRLQGKEAAASTVR